MRIKYPSCWDPTATKLASPTDHGQQTTDHRRLEPMRYLLGEKLHFDWKVVTITIVSTLLLMIDSYHRLTPVKYWDRVILYLVIPLAIILLVFRENPKEYGFSLGDWKAGLIITGLGILIMAPVIYALGRANASMHDYYKALTPGLPWTTFLDLIGWEFLFRGWILFGY